MPDGGDHNLRAPLRVRDTARLRAPGLNAIELGAREDIWNRKGNRHPLAETESPKLPPLDALKGDSDLDPEAWYVGAVEEANRGGLDVRLRRLPLRPERRADRSQTVCFAARFAGADISEPFSDVSSSPYYYWALAEGVVTDPQGELCPDDPCTRAETCMMLSNLDCRHN